MSRVLKATAVPKQAVTDHLARLNSAVNANRWNLLQSNENQEELLNAGYTFKNFKTTWKFLNLVATRAHSLRHHPTILTTYNNVQITLTTHDLGNILSYKDFELAVVIEQTLLNILEETKASTSLQVAEDLEKAAQIFRELMEEEKRKIN